MLMDNADLRHMLDARHRWILVDEYQDTNAVQYCIVPGLSIDHPNLAVTGDPDQAIYGWRGASIRNILEFERDYPAATVVTLEHNYRSTSNILGTADRLIAHNSRRKPKRLITDAPPGPPVRIVLDASSHDEADRIADEIAIALAGGQIEEDRLGVAEDGGAVLQNGHLAEGVEGEEGGLAVLAAVEVDLDGLEVDAQLVERELHLLGVERLEGV
jgi:DNA helicase-2/ATP-dependent DNA helicase PcrA